MLNKSQTLTDFLLHEEITSPPVNGSLTMVLLQIENSVKIIGSHIKQSGLVDILGKTGYKNAFNDEVQRFDDLSNTLLVTTLLSSGEVYAVASEELKEPIYSKNKGGDFIVCIDPLDGSSNVDCNASLGTIFSIYKKGDNILQKGNDQIAAGYVLYGPSIMFVLTTGKGVNGFTLDPSIGSFLLSHSNIIIPEKGSQYAINEGYSSNFTNQTKKFLKSFKSNGSKLRYSGCMVSDVHRILIQGGIFLYPADNKNPNGKLRLLYEINPMAFIINQAGGLAVSDGIDPLTILPNSVNQTMSIVLGSKDNVKIYKSF